MTTTQLDSDILDELRNLEPVNPNNLEDYFDVANEQAWKLLEALHVETAPITLAMLERIPGVVIERSAHAPVSSRDCLTVNNGVFRIVVDASKNDITQRFEIAHQLHHVLSYTDRPDVDWRCWSDERHDGEDFEEQLAEHFAWSLLLPEVWIRDAYNDGVSELTGLANWFDVDVNRMAFRLGTLRLFPGAETWEDCGKSRVGVAR